MASRTFTLVVALAGSFVGVQLATVFYRLIFSAGQSINYFHQFVLCGLLTASLAIVTLSYGVKEQVVLDNSLPSPNRQPSVSESEEFGGQHQPRQPDPETLTSHQMQLPRSFETIEVDEAPPSPERHASFDRILEEIRRVIEETPALAVDGQPRTSLGLTEQSPPLSQIATHKKTKHKKPKARHPLGSIINY